VHAIQRKKKSSYKMRNQVGTVWENADIAVYKAW
jgi:hypothetical protein